MRAMGNIVEREIDKRYYFVRCYHLKIIFKYVFYKYVRLQMRDKINVTCNNFFTIRFLNYQIFLPSRVL